MKKTTNKAATPLRESNSLYLFLRLNFQYNYLTSETFNSVFFKFKIFAYIKFIKQKLSKNMFILDKKYFQYKRAS